MPVRYDRQNDLFWVDGKQLFWSSIYVLRQKKASLNSLYRRLKVSKAEQPLFHEELDDLKKLGFVRGKETITVTKKGRDFLKDVEKKISFRNLREKGIRDIDEVFEETERVYGLDPRKTRLIVESMPIRQERVDWLPLFINSSLGCFGFLVAGLATAHAIGLLRGELFPQLFMLPIAAVVTIAVPLIVLWIFYYGGKGISHYLFRGRKRL